MIMISGNWEQVKDLSDIIRIVNENIGYEFAQKVEEICAKANDESQAEIARLNDRLDFLEDIENNFLEVEQINNYLNEELEELEKYIYENAYNADPYGMGMIDTYKK